MTEQQQTEINELTQYIRYLEAMSKLTIEEFYPSSEDDVQPYKKRKRQKICGAGVNISIPYSLMSHAMNQDSWLDAFNMRELTVSLKTFCDKEVKRAKAQIITICNEGF